MRALQGLVCVAFLAGCASTGVIQTNPNEYMLAKSSAGGMFVSGDSVKADLYSEANEFCAKRGLVVETISSEGKNAIPFARMPSANLNFRCAPKRTP